MKRFQNISIKWKLVSIIMISTSVSLILAILMFSINDKYLIQKSMVRNLTIMADIIGANSEAALTFDDKSAAEEHLKFLAAQQHITSASIYNAKGNVFASYHHPDVKNASIPSKPESDRYDFTGNSLILFQHVKLHGETIGYIFLQSDLDELNTRFWELVRNVFIALILISTLSFFLSSRLQRFISLPILRLARTTKEVSKKQNYSLRVEKKYDDEIGQLIDGFNHMLAQIQQRDSDLQSEIAERKRAQDELKIFTAKLAKSNRELQDFASIASHDLQEPLRKVQAFGDRLRVSMNGNLDEKGKDYLDRMLNASQRMQVLINDLLTYSRITTKAQPFAPVDLNKLVQEVLSDLEVRIEQVHGRVEVDDLPAVDADALQMRQLFQNLISNALKFHKKDVDPIVKIMCDCNDSELEASKNNVDQKRMCQITVADNGIGFDEKYREQIFVIFQRLHGRSEFEGTGIGLAVCRKIVERHGGKISASSIPGEGASFTFTLPLCEIEVAA